MITKTRTLRSLQITNHIHFFNVKEACIPTWVLWDTSPLSPWIKLLFLATTTLLIHWPVMWQAGRVWTQWQVNECRLLPPATNMKELHWHQNVLRLYLSTLQIERSGIWSLIYFLWTVLRSSMICLFNT